MARTYIYPLTVKRSDCKNMCPCGKMSNYKCRTYHPKTDAKIYLNLDFIKCKRVKEEKPGFTPDNV